MNAHPEIERGRILVTGSTGYIGGRLVPRLLEAGYPVRCLARDASRLQGRPWADQVEVAVGDVLDANSLVEPMRDVAIAYYLVHSMAGGEGFSERDLLAARNFGKAAKAASRERVAAAAGWYTAAAWARIPGGVTGARSPARGSIGVGVGAGATGTQWRMRWPRPPPPGAGASPPPSTWVGAEAARDVPQKPQWLKAATTVAPQFSHDHVVSSTGTKRAPRWWAAECCAALMA